MPAPVSFGSVCSCLRSLEGSEGLPDDIAALKENLRVALQRLALPTANEPLRPFWTAMARMGLTILDSHDKLEAMERRWKKAVEGLTPSGSEFVDDPENCARHIRERQSSQHEAIKKFKLRADKLEADVAALREGLNSIRAGVGNDDREPQVDPRLVVGFIDKLLATPNPGQALLDENSKLRNENNQLRQDRLYRPGLG